MAFVQMGFDSLPPRSPEEMMIRTRRKLPKDEAGLVKCLETGLAALDELIVTKKDAKALANHLEALHIVRKVLWEVVGPAGKHACQHDYQMAVLLPKLAAAPGIIPKWGQPGDFVVTVAGDGEQVRLRIMTEGIFGLQFPEFDAFAVDWDKPFVSATGFSRIYGGQQSRTLGQRVEPYIVGVAGDYFMHKARGQRSALQPIEYGPAGPEKDDPAWQPGGYLAKLVGAAKAAAWVKTTATRRQQREKSRKKN